MLKCRQLTDNCRISGTAPLQMMRTYAGSLFAIMACLTAGCSDGRIPTFPAEGRVIFPTGAPVRTGFVESRSLDHAINARGKIERDGSFTLGTYTEGDGAVTGRHQSVVIQFIAGDNLLAEQYLPKIVHDHGHEVDLSFADYTTSELEFTIKPDTKNFITLVVEPTSKPRVTGD